jgi:Fur family ferric uptake transcriptional regulator
MTHAPHTQPLPVADVAGAAAALRRRGGRLSQPRRQVLEALFAADGPVSAEQLAQGLGGRTTPVELTSVYRALEYLEELGLIRHVHLGHGPGLYALAGAHEREYLVCERCERVTAVEASSLDAIRAQIRDAFGYEARFSHFPIVGLCASCAAAIAACP